MNRLLKIGLLATTMLAMVAPAAAQRGGDRDGGGRGEGRGAGRSAQSDGGNAGGGERQRNWSAPSPQSGTEPTPMRQPRAPAVQNAPVPASNAGDWRRMPEARRDAGRSGGNPGGGNWQNGRGNDNRTPPVVTAPAQPQPQAQQRNWSRNNNGTGQGNWNRNDRDNRNGRDNADRNGRNDNDWNRGNNNWQQDNRGRNDAQNRDRSRPQQGYNYQRRLQDRDRWADTRRWDNSWRSNNRYDWQRYRTQNRNAYHLPSYYAPYGWNRGYSRFSIGLFLNNVLFASDYWIDDPYSYRLPPAYGPLRWVRYYDDAMLVDIRDGYVVDVIHDFFW